MIQERMEKLVHLGHEVSQEIWERLAPKAKRVRLERVNQDPEAPRVYQDLLDLALVTAQHLLTWRAQDSLTWTISGVPVVLQVPRALLAPLGIQWYWETMVQ